MRKRVKHRKRCQIVQSVTPSGVTDLLSCTSPGVRPYISHTAKNRNCAVSLVRISYLALVQDKQITCVLPANACCTVYVNCSPPPNYLCFSLFKINNSLYISFQSFINTQILTISHIILFQSMFVYFE